jgi:hypothetical protein
MPYILDDYNLYSKTSTKAQPKSTVACYYIRSKQVCRALMLETCIQKLPDEISARLSAILAQFLHGFLQSHWADAPELNPQTDHDCPLQNPYLFPIHNHVFISFEAIKPPMINKTVK